MTYGTMERIQTVTVGSGGAASIEFTNIPTTYDDLVVKMSTRNTATGVGDWQAFEIGFNGVTTNRSFRFLGGTGSAAISGSGTAIYGQSSSGSTTANTFANGEIYIPNYRSSNNKSLSIDQVTENNATSALIYPVAGLWSSTAAITSIQLASSLAGTFAQHSTATLYGITRVPAGAKATGGVIYDDSSYWYHVFTSSGTFTPSQNITADVLVVAGGGSGGYSAPGGGGSGGLLAHTSQSLTAINYTVTVGAGGAAVGPGPGSGIQGSNSQFGGLTASVGGGAGGGNGANGGNGGSGGGASQSSSTGGTATSGQGNNGAAFNGGGGGAGQAGAIGFGSGINGSTGLGGNGVSTYSSWGLATNTGENLSGTVWFAGGGGGYARVSGSPVPANGGDGGGGNAGVGVGALGAGQQNTGGGSGADSSQAGGSGIIIVRYAK